MKLKIDICQKLKEKIFEHYYDFIKYKLIPDISIEDESFYINCNEKNLNIFFEDILNFYFKYGKFNLKVTSSFNDTSCKIIFNAPFISSNINDTIYNNKINYDFNCNKKYISENKLNDFCCNMQIVINDKFITITLLYNNFH